MAREHKPDVYDLLEKGLAETSLGDNQRKRMDQKTIVEETNRPSSSRSLQTTTRNASGTPDPGTRGLRRLQGFQTVGDRLTPAKQLSLGSKTWLNSSELPEDLGNKTWLNSSELPDDLGNKTWLNSSELPDDLGSKTWLDSSELPEDLESETWLDSSELPEALRSKTWLESSELSGDLGSKKWLKSSELPNRKQHPDPGTTGKKYNDLDRIQTDRPPTTERPATRRQHDYPTTRSHPDPPSLPLTRETREDSVAYQAGKRPASLENSNTESSTESSPSPAETPPARPTCPPGFDPSKDPPASPSWADDDWEDDTPDISRNEEHLSILRQLSDLAAALPFPLLLFLNDDDIGVFHPSSEPSDDPWTSSPKQSASPSPQPSGLCSFFHCLRSATAAEHANPAEPFLAHHFPRGKATTVSSDSSTVEEVMVTTSHANRPLGPDSP